MVNKLNIITTKAILAIAALFSAIFAVFSICAGATSDLAYAAEESTGKTVELVSLKGEYFGGLTNGTKPIYEKCDCDKISDRYPKKVVATFRVTTEYYYLEQIGKSDTSKAEKTPSDGIVIFEVTQSGNYRLKMSGRSEENGENLGSVTVEFKVDADAPFIEEGKTATESMSQWLREGQKFVATVDWGVFSDNLSGVKQICYCFEYADGSKSDATSLDYGDLDKTSFNITENCTLVIDCYDGAGNGKEFKYAFDKFDFLPPPTPTYEITPEPKEGFYSSEYTINVTFLPDNGKSGLKGEQEYTIYENGEPRTRTFEQTSSGVCSIKLTTACNQKIVLYARDNAGNVSETKTIEIQNSAFDVTEPVIKGEPATTFEVLSSNAFFTVSVYATDKNESGISKATLIYGDKTYEMKPGLADQTSGYVDYAAVLSYDEFNAKVKEFTVAIEDYAGNRAERIGTISYFSDDEVALVINRTMQALEGYDKGEYTEAVAEDVQKNAETLNEKLSFADNAKAEIIKIAQSLIGLVSTSVDCSVSIESVPDYASGIISFSVTDADFASYKKGTKVGLVLTKGKDDGKDYVSVAGTTKAFVDFFGLRLTINGEEATNPLSAGLVVKMNMPSKYLDRTVVLVDKKTSSVVPSEIVNNAIRFTIKESTDYALVIFGDKTPASTVTEEKTITVFDKTMPLSRFLWIVCGCGGAALILIVVIILMKRTMG